MPLFSSDAAEFVRRWSASTAHERAVYQQFFTELCDLLGVPLPDPATREAFGFEKLVNIPHGDGKVTPRWIDFYKRGSFVLEAKQGSEVGDATIGTARRGTKSWEDAMRRAWAQALNYALHLPDDRPPFLITCDIGHVFEVWTGFDGHYGDYGARRTVRFSELTDEGTRTWLRTIFLDPWSLDPSRHSTRVTSEVAAGLAALARTLEASGYDPAQVAGFLMRCIFTMFAEDVGLLPSGIFVHALEERWLPKPDRFPSEVARLWEAMDKGLPFGFSDRLLRFNGGLFATTEALALSGDQLRLLFAAARHDWAAVEPAIFGTLVERALDASERERLGAHFTPRAYIERLVRPAVIEPLREEWIAAQAEARQILDNAGAEPTDKQRRGAIDILRRFHARLCKVRVLDPSCGTGNFLYVTFDLMKEIEAEVFRELADLGEMQLALGVDLVTVNPAQFLGIELNPRAREIADLVLWIGYLKWLRQGREDVMPPEPVLRQYKNIVQGDAVLAYDRRVPRLDATGSLVTVWDMRTYKRHPVTGVAVPDESARVPLYDYENPRAAEWPESDFIVSNPPFVGNKPMRQALGDGYAEALREAYPDVPATVDLVMYWWEKAATATRSGKVRGFGFITTNSITQVFNRGVTARHLEATNRPLTITWAIPDHPWVQAGAQVRIAMTVGACGDVALPATLGTVIDEGEDVGADAQARAVRVSWRRVARIHADLTAGANVAAARSLRANAGLSFQGMNLVGQGFRLTREELGAIGCSASTLPPVVHPYFNARDLTQGGEARWVIDLYGLSEEEARDRWPRLYQWLLERVKPEREQNNRESRRKNWWIFGEPVGKLRKAWSGLSRYIVTPKTARHRVFTFLAAGTIPDSKLYTFVFDDAYTLGLLSSRIHVTWANATGGWLGVGNDSTYNNTDCFEKFPFPAAKPACSASIAGLAERLDAHRRAVQAECPEAVLTAQYNALQRRRDAEQGGPALTDRERAFHERALIGVLRSLHDDLDASVAKAYGWPSTLTDEEILERLVALNAARAVEEAQGTVQWLRPDLQAPRGTVGAQTGMSDMPRSTASPASPAPWPSTVGEQLTAVRSALAAQSGALSAQDVARLFKNARREAVRRHLHTLEELGVLLGLDDAGQSGPERRWTLRGLAG